MVVALWTLVGLFWIGVAVRAWINRSDERKSAYYKVEKAVAFKVFDAWEFIRVKVLRRKPARPSPEDVEKVVIGMLADYGVRAAYVTSDSGERQLCWHSDDKANLDAFFAKMDANQPS